MSLYVTEKSIKGRQIKVKAIEADSKEITITGHLVKIAQLKEEDDADVENPEAILDVLRSSGVKIDLFTFWQRLPRIEPRFHYTMEWDNIAALRIESYEQWWTKQINDKTRNMVRKAEKKGVVVKTVPFADEFVQGIQDIYNETPVRQGRSFWHYGKDLHTIAQENGTYSDKSVFIGAYYADELIGFMKMVNHGAFGIIMQIISKLKYRDRAPTNALIAKAVEICAKQRIPYLVYAKFVYGKKGVDSLAEFKRSVGFKRIDIPRYYIPLTLRGKMALKLQLHHGVTNVLPERLVVRLLEMRSKLYGKYSSQATG
jgi:hypothetical protein